MKIEYTPERGRGFVRPGETGKPQNWGFSGIKKAAPKWSRLSEQITRCAVCVCDPKHKHGDDSRYQAGGQCNQSGSVRCHNCEVLSFDEYSLRYFSRAKNTARIVLIHALSFCVVFFVQVMFFRLILRWSLCAPVKQCAVVPHTTALIVFILWVLCRVAVILCGLFALSRQQENHRRPVVVPFPSFPVSQDLNGTGTEDYHAFRFCVLTR